jgi:RNA-binding protein YhbY
VYTSVLSGSTLISIFQDIKPTALIGSAGVGQSFTKEVIEAMSSINKVTQTSLTL